MKSHRYLRDKAAISEQFRAIIWTSAKKTVLTGQGITARPQSLETLEDIYTTIATVLNRADILTNHSDIQHEQIRNLLAQQHVLLVVDNLETVDDERVLNFIRDVPPPTKVLVTTRHRIDVAYEIHLLGMSNSEAVEYVADECLKKKVKLNETEIQWLIKRTGGVPLAITWSVAQMGYGYSVESVLERLGHPSNDIVKYCFEGSVEKIKSKPAYKLLLAISLFIDEASREALGNITRLRVLDIDDGLVDLEKMSLVNKKEGLFSLLPLTKIFATDELNKDPKLSRKLKDNYFQYYQRKLRTSTRRVVLIHASEDRPKVKALYDRLREAGYNPWLGSEDLRPGQNWEYELNKVIADPYNIMIICLSNSAITKRGFVQKEIRIALDITDEKPENTIFLIPVRLEPCELPRSLRKHQWVDLFEANGFKRLTKALDYDTDASIQSF